ncbi:cytochrome P450 [Cytobacillus suaedae]|nr:cytochrome P450 [Cytobacillus suaedae]
MNTTKTVKAPKGSIIGGNLDEFRKGPLAFFDKLRTEYKDVAKMRLANRTIYVLMSPDIIKEALVSKADSFIKSRALKEIMPLIGEGLLTSEGEFHMRQRRMMQPSFKKGHIQSYAEIMRIIASDTVNKWNEDEVRNTHVDMMNITLAIISKTMFSSDIQESHDTIGHPIDDANYIATKRIRSIFKLPYQIPTKENLKFQDAVRILDEVVFNIIEKRRQDAGKKKYEDLLGILMATVDETDQSVMTDRQIRDEAMTIFLAGHETTANAMSWCLYLLAKHPEIQKKVHFEIDNSIGSGPVKLEHTEQLAYLKNTIQESLRLYPPAWFFGREAKEDVQVGDLIIKKGQDVMYSPYITHRLEEYYDQPHSFIPERFENQFLKTIPSYAYFPFGGGPRVCIGNHFAMLEATIVMATILQNYSVSLTSPDQTVTPEALITLKPKDGLPLRMVRRK